MALPMPTGGVLTGTASGAPGAGLPILTSTGLLGQMTPGAGLLGQDTITAKLGQETELQKMLADERMRGEMHKTNYQMLKAEHTKLQDENRRLQRETESLRDDCRVMEERLQQLLNKSNRELAVKMAELEELRAQSLTPEKLELIKLKIAEDLEKPFRERFTQLESEVEHYRTEFNKLRYEHSFLKSEYEHEQAEHKRMVEEVKMQYETEIANLVKDKEAIVAKYSQENTHDSDKVRTLYRDNAQLNLKVKGLLTELDEIRAQREQVGLQSDHVSRLQARQLSEHAANIKALQSEKESLQLHMEQLAKELSISQDAHQSAVTRIHDLEKQNMELRGRLEETQHRHKMEVTDLKMEATKNRGELERDRDGLTNELEGLKAKCEVLQKTLESQKDAIAEKEKEVARKMQAVREEEWERVNRLEGEKLDLESRLQEFERLKIDEETRHYAEKEAGEERIREAEKRHEQTERELQTIRAKMEHQTSLGKDLEQEQTMNTQLREKCTRLKAELRDSQAAEQDLMAENDKLKETLEMLQNELVLVKAGMEREAERGEEKLTQHKMSWMDEKTQLERRLDELERKMKQAQKHREETIQAHAKKKKKYQKVVNRLQDKNQLLEAKNEQLELEKQALRNQIPKETYTKAVRRLRELQRRHAEFRNLMTSANLSQVPIGGMSFAAASVSQPLDASSPIKSTQHHDDLTAIRHRLDELSENQKLQMDALLGGGVGSVPMTARSEMEKEAEERPLSPDGSGMDMLDLKLESQKDTIAEKEKEVARKMQAVREEEWERVNTLEGEKLDLESRLQEFELLKIDKETRHYAEKEAGEERIREAEKRHEETQRELQTIRAKTEHQTSLGKDLEQEQTMNTQLAEKCTRLKAELRDSRAAEQDLMAESDKLKETLEMLQNELVLVKAGMEREAERGEEKLTQHKMSWMDEKTQLERRLDELERKMKQAQKHREEAIQAHAKKKKKYQKVVNRLQDKNQLLEAKNEQLELEKQALRNQIPKETYTKAVRRLRELQRRHAEFRNLMTSANLSQVPIGGMSFAAASVSQPLDASSPIKSTQVQRDDLTAIRHRLDELGENQKLQMDALLGGGMPMTARSEMEKEAEERPLSPDGSGMDMLDL